jgi:PadR family transcriptional regulator, regulatory protein PadR
MSRLIARRNSPDDALNQQRELYSGLIRVYVLHHACQQPIFGLWMIEELARHGYRLSAGTLYPLLNGMEKKGLLRSSHECVNGKFRRMYSATRDGRAALRIAKKRVKELFGELFEED